MKSMVFAFLLVLAAACGSGDNDHEPKTVDADDRPPADAPPPSQPRICEKDDPKNVIITCTGDPRVCRTTNRCR